MGALRIFKRSLLFFGLILFVFCISGAVLVYMYEDQLVSGFVAEANQKIDTPIHAGSIEASWWEKFPDISIVLNDVVIDGSLPGPADTLVLATTIYCTFNAWDIIRGQWIVDQIHMDEGRIFLVQTELGDNNFTIVKKDTSKQHKEAGFKLEKIQLNNVAVTYLDLRREQEYQLQVNQVMASLASRDQTFHVLLDGNVLSRSLAIGKYKYFTDKPLVIQGSIQYLQPQKKWDIEKTEITVNESTFLLSGIYNGSDEYINLKVDGQDTNVHTVLSLLPEEISQKFKKYRSQGDIYFKGHVIGSVSSDQNPELKIAFGCRNASFFHPDHKKGMEDVYLTGNYYSTKANDLSKATLSLKDVRGIMESKQFSANLTLSNLKKYHIKGDFIGSLDLNSWQSFLPPGQVTQATGIMDVDIAFDGPVNYLKTSSVDKFKTTGEIILNDLNFNLKKNSLPFQNFNGHFLFNGRDLAISDFTGTIGNSDFVINGFFRNIIAFVFSKNQPIGIEADLQSQNLDFDELLTGNIKARDQTVIGEQRYTSFEINPRLALTFNCKVDHLKFRRFRGGNIEGKLRIVNQVAHGQQIQFETLGGKISMNGRVDGRDKNHIRVYTKSSYQGIYIDSLFYVFENFGQDFLEDKHLRGQAFAEMDTYMAFDDHLRFKSNDLVVDAGLIIQNGELNNFEPLQKLSTYIDSQDLRHLQFADLKNNVRIKDREIQLPNMQVESNVTTIAVNGIHSFDQDINYRLKVPIKSAKKDKDEYFGAIEDDGLNTNLFLQITGTTHDYRVVLDKSAVKDKIRDDLKEEKWEFRKAVRNKGEKETLQELDDSEFFDFNESDSTTQSPVIVN